MRQKSRLFLRLAGGWLVLVNLGHTWGYYSAFVSRNLLDDRRQAAYELMKEPVGGGIMDPSFWTVLQMLALELSFFLAFAAITSFWIANQPDQALHRGFARISAVIFGLSTIAFFIVHPQINAFVIAAVAALLYSTAWWVA